MEDRELLREFAEGQSEKAFGELVARHVNLVYGAAFRVVGDSQMAQDIVQVVFIRLARQAKSIRDGNALAGWLYRATCNAAANAVRTEQRRRRREGEAVKEINSDPEGVWESMAPLLEEAMGQLSATDQDAVVLRYLEGKSHREVGQSLQMTEDAVQKRVSRALEKLKAHFARRGVKVSSALIAACFASAAAQAAPAGLAASVAAGSIAVGTGAGVTLTTFLKSVFMTKAKTTLVTAVLVGAVITPIVQHQQNVRLKRELAALRQRDAALNQRASNGGGLSQSATARGVAPAFDWRSLESNDYRKYIANLRAAGCPEQTIRDIVMTDLDRTYARRIARLSPSSARNYWEAPDAAVQTKLHVEMKALEQEKAGIIHQLLGIDADEESRRRSGLAVSYEDGFEFLGADKRARLREIDREYEARLIAISGVMPYARPSNPEEEAKRRSEADQWKASAIRGVLSAQELDEYELRLGAHANGLRWALHSFEPSEAEFRKVFQLEKQFGKDDYSGAIGRYPKPAEPEIEKQFQESLKQALGEQRFADYKLTQQSSYAMLYDIVRNNGLPRETTRILYDLHQAAEQRAQAIRTDTSLSAEARQAAFEQLQNELQNKASPLLGDAAFQLYRFQFGQWLVNKISK